MKKAILLVSFLVIFAAILSAEDVIWGSMYGKNNFCFSVDAAVEASGSAAQLALYPEAEMLLWKPLIADIAFIDIGAAVEARLGIPVSSGSGLSAGAGLLGTMHMGFRGFEFTGAEYLSRIDLYVEAGLKYDFIGGTGFGGVVKSGVNYFLSERFAVGAFYSNWGGFGGGGLSVSLKLGDTPEVKGISFKMPELAAGYAVDPYLLQFYTLYYSSNFAGGNYPGSYKTGEGAVRRVSTMSGNDMSSYTVEHRMLKTLDDGSIVWGLSYEDGDDLFYYEYVTDDEKIKSVYYSDDDRLHEYNDINFENQNDYQNWKDFNAESKRDVTVNVEAGKFDTIEYYWSDENGVTAYWWLAENVPGALVSYKWEDVSDIVTSELIEITRNNKSRLYK